MNPMSSSPPPPQSSTSSSSAPSSSSNPQPSNTSTSAPVQAGEDSGRFYNGRWRTPRKPFVKRDVPRVARPNPILSRKASTLEEDDCLRAMRDEPPDPTSVFRPHATIEEGHEEGSVSTHDRAGRHSGGGKTRGVGGSKRGGGRGGARGGGGRGGHQVYHPYQH